MENSRWITQNGVRNCTKNDTLTEFNERFEMEMNQQGFFEFERR